MDLERTDVRLNLNFRYRANSKASMAEFSILLDLVSELKAVHFSEVGDTSGRDISVRELICLAPKGSCSSKLCS